MAEHGLAFVHRAGLQVRAPLIREVVKIGIRQLDYIRLCGRSQVLELNHQRLPLVLKRVDTLNERSLMPDLGQESSQVVDLSFDVPDSLAQLVHLMPLVRSFRFPHFPDFISKRLQKIRGKQLAKDLVQHCALDRFFPDGSNATAVSAAVVAALPVDSGAALAEHETGEQVVISAVSALAFSLFVARPKNRFRFRIRDHRFVRIPADLPLRPIPVPSLACADVGSVNEFLVPIPDRVPRVGESAVFKVYERGIRYLDTHS